MSFRDIADYDGLVIKTSRMFADLVGLEREDLEQEIRLKILKVLPKYDPSRSKMTERAFVFSCVTNLVKDLKKARAWRVGRLQVAYIDGFGGHNNSTMDVFEARFLKATHDETLGSVDEGPFTMPSTVTPQEEEVIYLLVIGYAQTEIAEQLEVDYSVVLKLMRGLREKLADWKPPLKPEPAAGPTALPVPAPALSQAVAA